MLDYWFRSPPGFIYSLGVDPQKMPTESELTNTLKKKFLENQDLKVSKLNALAICYQDRAIGVHTLNPLIEGDYGIFHAHIWPPEMRRRGIGMISYPLACNIFIGRFNLKRILFKTPVQNTGSIRVKEKLGIRLIGEELIDYNIIRAGTPAKVFELLKAEAAALRALGFSQPVTAEKK